MIDIPTLQTERLILRAQGPQDTAPLTAAFADDDFARYITRERRALSVDEAWRPIAMGPGSWHVSGFGPWMAEDRATGAPVGRVGPWQPAGWPDFEIGWIILPDQQGKGYATEAAAAAMVWVRGTMGRDYVIHNIEAENVASQRVARALGSEPTGEWDLPWGGTCPIWTTRWERFALSEPYRRHVAAAAARP